MLYYALRETAPIRQGDNNEYFILIELSLQFLLLAYPGWVYILLAVLCYNYCTVIVKTIIYEQTKIALVPLLI